MPIARMHIMHVNHVDTFCLQPKFGQPVLPNLNVRHLCPNCREDPPNIVEEYSSGDLVRCHRQGVIDALHSRVDTSGVRQLWDRSG